VKGGWTEFGLPLVGGVDVALSFVSVVHISG
jgi:hypothetical protein